MCVHNDQYKLFYNLQRPLELDSLDRNLWSDKCNYVDPNECSNLNPNNHNLIVLQLNIRSILTHQDDLKRLLNKLENKNSKVDIVLLCETHLSENTAGFVIIPKYRHIASYCVDAKGGGTSILIRDNIPYRRRKDLEIFEEKLAESTYIEITGRNEKQYIVGSLNQSLNALDEPLTNHLSSTLQKLRLNKEKKEIILGMDHNIDLLKSQQHPAMEKFLDTMLINNMLPTIT